MSRRRIMPEEEIIIEDRHYFGSGGDDSKGGSGVSFLTILIMLIIIGVVIYCLWWDCSPSHRYENRKDPVPRHLVCECVHECSCEEIKKCPDRTPYDCDDDEFLPACNIPRITGLYADPTRKSVIRLVQNERNPIKFTFTNMSFDEGDNIQGRFIDRKTVCIQFSTPAYGTITTDARGHVVLINWAEEQGATVQWSLLSERKSFEDANLYCQMLKNCVDTVRYPGSKCGWCKKNGGKAMWVGVGGSVPAACAQANGVAYWVAPGQSCSTN